MNRFSLLIPACVMMALATPSRACSDAAQKASDLGAASYRNRIDITEAKNALDFYDKAVAADPSCVEALVKGSRAAWWVADHEADHEKKLQIFKKGMDWAKAGVALASTSAEAHYWLAGNMGSYGEARGVLKSLFLVKPIRRELEEVIKLDPTYDRGAAYQVLGAVDYKVPGFAGGSKKRALDNLSKALALGPQIGSNRFYLAEYYFTVGDKLKTREQLTILKNLTATDDDKPELLLMQQKGVALGNRLKDKSS